MDLFWILVWIAFVVIVALKFDRHGPENRNKKVIYTLGYKPHPVDPQLTQPSPVSGVAFETECARVLTELGFRVKTTPLIGDYGVDLIVTKDGLSYSVQCKSCSNTVGVAAVQEAFAGRQHYLTDYAVVVSRTGFTAAARTLSSSTRVILVSFGQLRNIETLARILDGV